MLLSREMIGCFWPFLSSFLAAFVCCKIKRSFSHLELAVTMFLSSSKDSRGFHESLQLKSL